MASSGITQAVGGKATGITAHAGGVYNSTYTAAETMSAGVNVISVCATAGDSVILPAGIPQFGCVDIFNTSAAVADVTPNVGATINGGTATSQQFGIAAATGATFVQVGTDGLTWVATNCTAPTA